MTEKLYYQEPYTKEFSAAVVDISGEPKDGGYHVILDRTCFYPEGGGQPADIGIIGDAEVTDVKKHRDAVIHVFRAIPSFRVGDKVTCAIDWEHRFDYMQQHTGQHIISGALFREENINTLSVHMGEEYTTVEVDVPTIQDGWLEGIEDSANKAIWNNLEIRSSWIDDSQVSSLGLRRAPKVGGKIRIIQIDGADRVACGGVHVSRTSEIGLVKAIGVESIRGHARIIWKIGKRAIVDYRTKSQICNALTDTLSTPIDNLAGAVENLTVRLNSQKREANALQQKYADAVASFFALMPDPVITHHFHDEDRQFLKVLSQSLQETPRPFCLTNVLDDNMQWCIGLPPGDSELPRSQGKLLLDELLPIIKGKGGGKPPVWQGVGSEIENADVFLRRFAEMVKALQIG